MYNGIRRESGLFTPEISDELNNSFSNTLQKIENFQPTPLDYKYNTSSITVSSDDADIENNSFIIENKEVWLNIKIKPHSNISSNKVATLVGISVPDIIWIFFSEKHSVKSIHGYIQGTDIFVNGTLEADTEYLLSTYFIMA